MIHALVQPLAHLATTLHNLGVKGQLTVVLSSESDGEAFEQAIKGQTVVAHVPFDPQLGHVQRTATIAGVKFVWPSADPSVELAQEKT